MEKYQLIKHKMIVLFLALFNAYNLSRYFYISIFCAFVQCLKSIFQRSIINKFSCIIIFLFWDILIKHIWNKNWILK